MEEAGSAHVSHAAHFSVSTDIERPPQGTCAHRGECSEAHLGKNRDLKRKPAIAQITAKAVGQVAAAGAEVCNSVALAESVAVGAVAADMGMLGRASVGVVAERASATH